MVDDSNNPDRRHGSGGEHRSFTRVASFAYYNDETAYDADAFVCKWDSSKSSFPTTIKSNWNS
jgi:hypothetical protein